MTAFVTSGLLRQWPLPHPNPDGDKVDRGQILVVAGSVTTPGAALLSGIGALRAGAGKLQVLTTRTTAIPLAVALPEALVAGLPETDAGGIDPASVDHILERAGSASAVLVGPGMADDDAITDLLRRLLPKFGELDASFVLDAAAVRCLPRDLTPMAGRVVMTPNHRELADLLGVDPDDVDAARAQEAAAQFGAVVTTKGCVAAPDGRVWEHDEGNVGLGTSGSGDVLAGVVAGLMARRADPAQAAIWGMAAHARAGTRLGARFGTLGYLARELLDEIPAALAELTG
jgi:hydroxyethylthiazole kinase-like uncharacterized protein yjeF